MRRDIPSVAKPVAAEFVRLRSYFPRGLVCLAQKNDPVVVDLILSPIKVDRAMSDDTKLELARKQIEFARAYTKTLLADVEPDEWFKIPEGCVSHLAWQVGHLAMAQYGLCLFRIRGRQPIDTELMSSSFRKKYSKGTTPDPDPANNPAPEEICQVFEDVYEQTMQELPGYDETMLNEPVDMPYAAYATKLGGLLFCSHHEMIHAGQIGLLRRLLGKSPIR